MEVIELSGYTHEEKREIAKRYLVPRQMERNGVGRSKIEFTDEAVDAIIEGYTREAGVRGLEREIGSVCRKVAREFAEGKRTSKRTIRPKTVGDAARQAALPAGDGAAHRRARGGHGAGLDAGGRRRAVRGGHRVPGRRQAPDHRTARRRDEGVRRGRALVRQERRRRRSTATCPRTGSATTTCTSTCPAGAIPKDGPSAGHHHGHGDRLQHHRAPGPRRHRDDG